MPKPVLTQDLEALRTRLRASRLGCSDEALPEFTSEAVRYNWNAPPFRDELLRWELERRVHCNEQKD